MRIKIILPITQGFFDERQLEVAEHYAAESTEITCIHLQKGPETVENQVDNAFAVPGILEEVKKAEDEGYDGVFISCIGDPGLKAAREAADIPVVGAAETSLLFASALAQSFSVITVLPSLVPMIEDHAKLLGVREKLASIRNINVGVAEINAARESGQAGESLYEESIKAIENDGAHALILGGTCMAGVGPDLEKKLAERNGYRIPVIDSGIVPVKFLEALVSLGLKQSTLTYMTPAEKERTA